MHNYMGGSARQQQTKVCIWMNK